MKSYLGRHYLNERERENWYNDFLRSKDYEKEQEGAKRPDALLLDSSLITATQNFRYDIKIIECGDYIQAYYFENLKTKTSKKEESSEIDIDYLFKNKNTYEKRNELKTIEFKNVNRSKFQLQRLVKSNEDKFKTFLTLTFADNLSDVNEANKKFAIWRTKIKSIYKDFQYVCVPEFQKRGAVHYHLLTNLEINKSYKYTRRCKHLEVVLIIPQEHKKSQYDVKYWPYGYSSVFSMKDINVVGYLSKYMTKDIDNRLFGHRRYFNSYNLKIPSEYIFEKDSPELIYFLTKISNSDITYRKKYLDIYGNEINYVEYKKSSTGE